MEREDIYESHRQAVGLDDVVRAIEDMTYRLESSLDNIRRNLEIIEEKQDRLFNHTC